MICDLQRASLLKRVSALLLDLILICIVATGAMYALSAVTGYDEHSGQLTAYYEQYASAYGLESFDIDAEAYEKMSEEEKAAYADAYEALATDEDVLYTYNMVVNLTLVITSLGILFAFLIIEFIVPLILKNGQTVGKKIFGLCLVRRDGVRVTSFMMFVRALLGKYTIETMFPILLLVLFFFGSMGLTGILIPVLLLLAQIVLLFATKNHTVIHDSFAQTVVVDMASQMIFDSYEDLVAYKTKLHAEEAAHSPY